MIYRKAKKDDCKILDGLLSKLIDDECNYDPNCKRVNVKDFYINFVDDKSKFLYLAQEGNNIVGYIYVKEDENKALIDALYVLEEYRNRGIASKLIEDAILHVKQDNIKEVTINVLSNNIKAKNLYLKYFKLFKQDNNKETLILEVK